MRKAWKKTENIFIIKVKENIKNNREKPKKKSKSVNYYKKM